MTGVHDIELKIPEHPPDGDGQVVPYDLGGNLAEGFRKYRVYFPGHDGRSRLNRRNQNLPDSAPGPGTQPADVVGDLSGLRIRS